MQLYSYFYPIAMWMLRYSYKVLYAILKVQYRNTNPVGKARGMSVSILHIQSEGLVNNYFLAYCSIAWMQ